MFNALLNVVLITDRAEARLLTIQQSSQAAGAIRRACWVHSIAGRVVHWQRYSKFQALIHTRQQSCPTLNNTA
jgi:hypothetical protein